MWTEPEIKDSGAVLPSEINKVFLENIAYLAALNIILPTRSVAMGNGTMGYRGESLPDKSLFVGGEAESFADKEVGQIYTNKGWGMKQLQGIY